MKVYLPNLNNISCAEVLDHDTIRVYESSFSYDTSISFTDYFVNSHYLSKNGSIVFAQGSTFPSCISSSDLTDEVYYRNDFASIMIIFFMISIICFYFPYKIFARAFGRWLKI